MLVLNDTMVVKARLRGTKASGGRVELLVERVTAPCEALCLVRVSKPLRDGGVVTIARYGGAILRSPGSVLRDAVFAARGGRHVVAWRSAAAALPGARAG